MCFAMLKSSLGKKYVMAVTGLLLLLFVISHLLGNLQIFLGAEWLNSYSEHLEEMPYLLWPARAALLTALILHIGTAARLTIENRKARPVPYRVQDTVQASLASRTMMITGSLVLFFIVYHLMHFTFSTVDPRIAELVDSKGREDVYSMVVLGFRDPVAAGVYVVAMYVLSMHLGHGSWSFLQSLGLTRQSWLRTLRKAGALLGWLVFLGFASIPAAVQLGWLQPLQGGR